MAKISKPLQQRKGGEVSSLTTKHLRAQNINFEAAFTIILRTDQHISTYPWSVILSHQSRRKGALFLVYHNNICQFLRTKYQTIELLHTSKFLRYFTSQI